MGMSHFPKKGVSQQTCEACGEPLPAKKTVNAEEILEHYTLLIRNLTVINICSFNCCAPMLIRIQYVFVTMHKYMGTYLYGTKTDPGEDGSLTE